MYKSQRNKKWQTEKFNAAPLQKLRRWTQMSKTRGNCVDFNHCDAAVKAFGRSVAALRVTSTGSAGFQHCIGANESQRDFLKCILLEVRFFKFFFFFGTREKVSVLKQFKDHRTGVADVSMDLSGLSLPERLPRTILSRRF